MAISFTPEQQRVIELRGSNVLVSAAAGSGKTAVLVERIVRMVCDGEHPVDIDRLLIVTFTSAAAAEMRERIAAGIQKRLLEQPGSAHIQKQATLLHNAQITTIDSFCLFLLKNHFHEIGLDPAFRIADEGEIRLMQQEVMGELLEDSYASGSRTFCDCVEYFCPGGKESRLEQHILNLSRYASSFPWPAEWLEERQKDYAVSEEGGPGEDACGRYLLCSLKRTLEGCAEKLKQVQRLCQEPDGPYMYGELVDAELEQLERLADCGTLEQLEQSLPAVSFGRLPAKKDETVLPLKRELAKNLRSQVKDCVQELSQRYFATPLALAAKQSLACQEPVDTLIGLVLDFDRRMRDKKQEKKVIDFSDMEHFALDILLHREGDKIEPSRVALEYRQHFAEILTDEYQDSNLVQEFLLSAVSGEDDGHFNRFMVGDVKQSIYRFRLARPELFLEKYQTYAESGERVRIDLAKNFRSRAQVVDAVNDVFARLMSEETGGLTYDERAALYTGSVYPENEPADVNDSELLLIEKPESAEEMGAKEAEARAIAEKIKRLREGFLVTDKESGTLRPARFSDMVILLRTNSGWDEEFKTVLEREGIPVYISSKTGYFAATEVQELLQLLRVLDNPTQDIPLFGTLKSVFGGFSEEEIASIRSRRKGCSLYEALKSAAYRGQDAPEQRDAPEQGEMLGQHGGAPEQRDAPELSEETVRKAGRFLDMLSQYRQKTVYLPVRELLTELVTDFDYLDYVTALPAGSKRRANVEMLFTKASDFEKTSYYGLFHFIRYIEQLEKYDVDYGEADELDENADVVRIMSIHKSKGLEFPIVFVAGLSKRFNMQDANQSLIVDMDLGLATDYVDTKRRVRNKTLRRLALARKLREDSLSEELRVLYVALTRAKEKLILTAVTDRAAERWEQCRSLGGGCLTAMDFMEAGSYLELLLPVLPGTSIRVSVTGQEDFAEADIREQFARYDRRQLLAEAAERADADAAGRLRERLATPYRFKGLAGLYTKTTVSELKIAAMAGKDEEAYHAFEEKEIVPYIPRFRRGEEQISGTVRGNAYHRVMELLDFARIMEGKEEERRDRLRAFLAEQTAKRTLSGEYAAAVNEEKLLQFLGTPLAQRMCSAQKEGRLYREQPFVLGISADRLGKEFPDGETVLIQGIIDVFFVEEDGLVLLDYKTDSVRTMQELWNRYETQLDYYSEALQKLMRQPVRERLLYSFHLGTY